MSDAPRDFRLLTFTPKQAPPPRGPSHWRVERLLLEAHRRMDHNPEAQRAGLAWYEAFSRRNAANAKGGA